MELKPVNSNCMELEGFSVRISRSHQEIVREEFPLGVVSYCAGSKVRNLGIVL
jgi:hypothetical protein